MSREFKKFSEHCHFLKRLLNDTQNVFDDICRSLQLGREIKEEFLDDEILKLQNSVDSSPAILVHGQNCHSKALLLNKILRDSILPLFSKNWRWVRFLYGQKRAIRLTLGLEYEIVENLKAHEEPWTTIPEKDLQRDDNECLVDHCPSLEVMIDNPFLRDNIQILIPPDCSVDQIAGVMKGIESVLPVILYAITEDLLSDKNVEEIRRLKEFYHGLPILFVCILEKDDTNEALTESERHERECKATRRIENLRNQLTRLGYLQLADEQNQCLQYSMNDNLVSDAKMDENFVGFVHDILQQYILNMATALSEKHNKCLRKFILSVYDMAREIQITPVRIQYAQKEELILFDTLLKLANEKQEEITRIIQRTLCDMKLNVDEVLREYRDRSESPPQSAKIATLEIQQIVLRKLTNSVAEQLVQSVGCLRESFTGTLQRCLESLEKNCHDLEPSLLASGAFKQIVTAAYNIDLKSSSSFSVVHSFMDRLRQFLHSIQLPWTTYSQPQCNLQWQIQVVNDIIDSLSHSKLAKTICTQFQEHVKASHETFLSAMRCLENQLSGQLEQTEEQRIIIRKQHAPRFARLALESTSLCDYIKWGMPQPVREIGRGQYGVVWACEPWGEISPCAYKSVVPPEEKQWNDLSLEFYHTRTIPDHPRIVKLWGSVIDYTYAGGSSPAVLLMMERMTRDLFTGLKSGLTWPKRIQIAIDVVEGIRYLHSQGLVHRDIKLKNVLLDNEDRAKLTDFGFCMPEPMISGSIVGTPIHMAPELLTGRYDSSVDVYAFGILFWYLCAGHVHLPNKFEQFHSKEQLWTSVRKGVRPECLAVFYQECWNLMEQCWSAEPSQRPLLGHILPKLQAIQRKAAQSPGKFCTFSCSCNSNYASYRLDDSYYYNYNYMQLREY